MCEVDLEDGQRKEEWQSTQENRLVLRGAAGAPPSLRHRMWMQRGLVCVCWCVCVCVCVLVCGVCVYVLVCVCWCVWRRRREAAEEAEKPGIQNQKQEPHTKMWGKTLSTSALKLFKTVSTLVETCSLPRTVSKLLSDLSLTQKMVSTNCPFQHRMLLVPLALC